MYIVEVQAVYRAYCPGDGGWDDVWHTVYRRKVRSLRKARKLRVTLGHLYQSDPYGRGSVLGGTDYYTYLRTPARTARLDSL